LVAPKVVPNLFSCTPADNPHSVRAEATAMGRDQQVIMALCVAAQRMIFDFRFTVEDIDAGRR
jgi:hypothetical protein